MSLKATISSLSEVEESLHGEYEERDGKFVLKLDGEIPGFVRADDYGELKQKVVLFRDNYTGLMKRAKEIAGVDEMDDALTPLRSTIESLKSKLAEASTDPNSQSLQEQIQKAIKPLQEKLDRSEAERLTAQERASKALLRENIGAVLTKAGAQPNALGFLLDQSETVFEVKDDKVVARDGHFTEQGKPTTPSDWLAAATKEFDFAFKRSSGGGASPSNGEPAAGSNILRNPTPEQLGAHMDDISSGKIQIVND